MKRITALFLILLLTQGTLLPVSAVCAVPDHDGYLIRLAEGAPLPADEALEFVVPGVYWTKNLRQANRLLRRGEADVVEPNYEVFLFDTAEDEPTEYTDAYAAVHAAAAAEQGLTGKGVRIAIIDSGLDMDNPNLTGADLETGFDYVRGAPYMKDTDGHGTHVAQMIAGDGSDGMVRGVASEATIVPLRCFQSGSSNITRLLKAIEDAADPEKYDCDIINMSWGLVAGSSSCTILESALLTANANGVLLVAAAGNVQSGLPQGTTLFPAVMDCVIGVGSVGADQTVSAFSQQTPAVDVCAPGESLLFCSIKNKAILQSGTSFSAPVVTGILALLRQSAPEMSPAFAQALLRKATVDLGDAGRDNAYGHGFTDMSVLLSPSACFMKDVEGGTACWLPADGSKVVYFAAYDASGRMLSLDTVTLTEPNRWYFYQPAADGSPARRKAFVLSEEYLPWRAALTRTYL